MKPEDLDLLRTPGRPALHPSQEWAVVAISRPDLTEDAYRSRLWRLSLTGEGVFALTSGPSDSEPVVSPDGRWIAFLRAADGPAQLAVLDTRGGEPRVLTSHRLGVSGRPVWSPGSDRIAYTAAVPEEGRYGTKEGVGPDAEPARHITTFTYRSDGVGFTQGRPRHLHVVAVPSAAIPAQGGQQPPVPLRLTDGPEPVSDPVWTPDGRALLALRQQPDALVRELLRLEVPLEVASETAAQEDEGRAEGPTSAPSDGESGDGGDGEGRDGGDGASRDGGHSDGGGGDSDSERTSKQEATRRRDGVLVPVPVSVIALPHPGLDVDALGFAPHHERGPMDVGPRDGADDALDLDLPDDPDEDAADLAPIGQVTSMAAEDLPVARPAPTHTLYLLMTDYGPDAMDFVGRCAALWSARLTGDELTDAEQLTDPETEDLAGGTGAGQLQVTAEEVWLRRARRGRVELVALRREDEAVDLRVVHPGSVTGAVALADGRALVSATLPDSPGEVLLVEPATLDATSPDGVTALTDLASELRAGYGPGGIPVSREITGVSAPDGYPVHGWLTLPDPARYGQGPYPVLLMIHGGPYSAYEDVFFDEVQVATGAGYAVVHGNPRGSAGYGRAHGRAIVGGFGTVDAEDVLALLGAALAQHPQLDETRVGVMGGSYGGYLTAWLTTRPGASATFRGAIVERGFLDPVSFEGSSDIGWFFGLRYLGTDPAAVAAQSPMTHLDQVTTPTLVIHSEHDWRCPVEQGQRWYVGLKRRGVPTELLLFPGEGHELSRSGRPAHRRQRFEAVLKWWTQRLG